MIASFNLVSIGLCLLVRKSLDAPHLSVNATRLLCATLVSSVPLILPRWMVPGDGLAALAIAFTAAVFGVVATLTLYFELSRNVTEHAAATPDDEESSLGLVAELDDVRRRLRELSDVSGDWVWACDANGIVTYASDGAHAILGDGSSSPVGRHLLAIGHPETGNGDDEAGVRLMGARRVFRNLPLRCTNASGENCLILLSGSPRFDSTGTFCGYNGVANDATAETRLREARAAAQAKDSFFASMTHEIRTPLNGVLGILDILKDSQINADQSKLVATAINSGESLLRLINDILDLSKLEAGRFEILPEPADLGGTVGESVEAVRTLAMRNGTTIAIEGLSHLPALLSFDRQRYRQILLNLLGNAIKFTHSGAIRVVVEPRCNAKESIVLRTSVIDTGPGISEAQQKLLFQEFSKLKDPDNLNASGTGLGLALSRGLAEAMGGTVGVSSEVGKGSTFWFDIEFLHTEVPLTVAAASGPVAAKGSQGTNRAILLVEDDQTNVLVATRLLTAAGHIVTHAENGWLAVETFNKNNFDIIFMDVSMPVMDGIAATKEIRRLESEHGKSPTPIVALTAHAIATERERIIAAGMTGYVSKPVRKVELLAAVDHYALQRTEFANASQSIPTQNDAPKLTASKDRPLLGPLARPHATQSPPARKATSKPSYLSKPILDVSEFQSMQDEVGASAVPGLMKIFVEELTRRADALEDASRKQDLGLLKDTCHAMAGSTATLGAARLHTLCKRVEEACKVRPNPRFFELVPIIRGEVDALKTHLSQHSF